MAGQSEVRAGGAFVELSVRSAKFNAGLRAAAVSFKRFGSSITAMGKTALLMDLLKLAPLAIFAKHASDVGSELADMADRTGMSIESLSALKFAAGQTGSTIEDLEKSVKKMQKAIADDASEEKFAKLGIDLKKIRAMNPEEQFNTIANAISKITDPTFRTAAAMEIFGKSGTGLLPMLIGGRKGIETLTARAKELGLVMSTEDARAAEEFGDALQTMKDVGSRAMTLLGSGLIPALKGISEGFMNTSKTVLKWISDNRALVVTIASGAAAFIALDLAIIGLGMSLSAFGVVLGAISSVFGVVKAGIVALVANWKLFIAAVAGGAIIKSAVSSFGPAFSAMADDVKGSWASIVEALSSGDLAAAGKTGMALIELEWTRLTGAISESWNEVITTMLNVWTSFSASLAKIGGDFVADMLKSWESLKATVVSVAAFIVDTLGKALNAVWLMSDEDFATLKEVTSGEVKRAGDDAREEQLRLQDEQRDFGGAIDDQRDAAQQARLDAQQSKLDAAKAELEAAKQALNDAKGRDFGGSFEDTADIKDSSDPAELSKAAAMGTFDAGMASRIFGSANDVPKKQLKAQEQTRDEIKLLRREINKGGLAFG